MNYSRIVLAGVAAWIVDLVYGFVVYGNLLAGQFAAYPGVYRGPADMKMLPLFGGLLLASLALAAIYSKGYEGRSGIAEGVRFGVLIAILMLASGAIGSYSLLNIGGRLAASMAAAGIVEFVLVGATIGLVYKPAVQPRARAAAI